MPLLSSPAPCGPIGPRFEGGGPGWGWPNSLRSGRFLKIPSSHDGNHHHAEGLRCSQVRVYGHPHPGPPPSRRRPIKSDRPAGGGRRKGKATISDLSTCKSAFAGTTDEGKFTRRRTRRHYCRRNHGRGRVAENQKLIAVPRSISIEWTVLGMGMGPALWLP